MPLSEQSTGLVGLSEKEASRRLAEHGPNEPAPSRRRSTATTLLLLFLNPLAIVLLIAAGFSAFLGQAVDATIIVLVVALGNRHQLSGRPIGQNAPIERLRETVMSTTSVLRDEDWKEIPRRDVVLGDVVRLFAGDLVPADARLVESKGLICATGGPHRRIASCRKGNRPR